MVFQESETRKEGSKEGMGGGHNNGDNRSLKSPLHNFKLPEFPTWGCQRQLRCMLPAKNDARNNRPSRLGQPNGPTAIGGESIAVNPSAERLKGREEESAKRWNLRARNGSVACVSSAGAGIESCLENQKRKKFSVSLSKKEIEEDFIGMVGHSPPRRPMKRPRVVQRQLDFLFPGLRIREVTADMYKVREGQSEKK